MSFHDLRRARRDRQFIFKKKLTLTNTVIIEIVPREAGGTAGAKVGQNTASVTGRAGEGTPALAGPAGGVTFCREMRHGGSL